MYLNKCLKLIDENYLRVQKDIEEINSTWKRYTEASKKICIFGAGECGVTTYWRCSEINVTASYFCDNDISKEGKEIVNGVKCINLNLLIPDRNNIVFIIAIGNPQIRNIVKNQLLNAGFNDVYDTIFGKYEMQSRIMGLSKGYILSQDALKQKIQYTYKLLEDEGSKRLLFTRLKFALGLTNTNEEFADQYEGNQYFLCNGKYLKKGEVIIDCGAYNGDTLKDLLDEIKYSDFKKYICYELDPDNVKMLETYVDTLPKDIKNKIEIKNSGVGEKNETIYYNNDRTNSKVSNIISNNTATIKSLDEDILGEDVSFIKMDVEGFELATLKGAKNLIIQKKPQIACSIYHKFEDIWELIPYLKELVPEYHFIIRHHTLQEYDTVCYASIKPFVD